MKTLFNKIKMNAAITVLISCLLLISVESWSQSLPPPTALAATNITTNGFTAHWTAVSGALGYKIDVSTSSTFATFVVNNGSLSSGATSQAYSNGPFTSGTTYYYRLRTVSSTGNSYNSNTISLTTLGPPSPPSSFSTTNVTTGSFTANWGSVSTATGYYLDVSADNFSSILPGYNNLSVGGTSQNVTGLSSNTGYYYRVRSTNSYGTSGNSGTTTTGTLPNPPTLTGGSSITTTSFYANWASVAGASTYYVDISTASDFSSFVVNSANVPQVYFYVNSASANTPYYYRVRTNGGYGVSSYSTTGTIWTLPSTPLEVGASNWTSNSFTVSWDAVQNATGYYLDISADNFSTFVSGYNNLAVSGTSQNVTGLQSNASYYYRVRAANPSGLSASSAGYLTGTLPSTPTATAATNVSATSFIANWSAVSGASTYQIDVSAFSNFSSMAYQNFSVSTNSITVSSGISAATTYYYRVRAVGNAISSNSNVITLTTTPPAPTSFSTTNITTNSFTVNWGSVSSATSYYLDVSTDNFSSFVPGYNNLSVSGTSQNITGLSSNTGYYYRVRSANGYGTSPSSSTTTTGTLPLPPTLTGGSSITTTSFYANWASVAGASTYYVDISTASDFSSFIVNSANTPQIYFFVNSASANTPYYYRVRTNSGYGVSGYSTTGTIWTLPSTPLEVNASNLTSNSFTVSWDAVQNATGYYLDISTDNFSTFVSGYNNLAVSGTSQNVTGLQSNTSYNYRVRAANPSGLSANSAGYLINTPPDTPTATAATGVGATSFTANWSAVSGADAYQIDVSAFSNFSSLVYLNTSVSTNSITVSSGISAATTYYYRVRATSSHGMSSNSNVIAVLTYPAAPVANAATSIATTSFTANWNSVSGTVSGYRLDVSTNSSFSPMVSGYNDLSVAGTSQSVTGLATGTTYYYRARAANATGSSASSGTISALTFCAAPALSAATGVTSSSFIANWGAVTGAASYTLETSTDNFTSILSTYTGLTGTSYSVTGLSAGTNYYYRLRAINASGASVNSNTNTQLLLPAAPTANAATSITTTSITAHWSGGTGVTGYNFDLSTSGTFSSFVGSYNNFSMGNVTTYTITGLTPGTTYYYRLRATNASGSSSNSNIVSLITVPTAPVLLAATSVTTNSFVANWSSTTGATSYTLETSIDNFTSVLATYSGLSGTSYAVAGLSAGTTYYYRLRALNGWGTSSNSSTNTQLLLPVAPTANAATSITTTSMTANWTTVAGATEYHLDVATDNLFTNILAGFNDLIVASNSSSVSGLTQSSIYYYRVRAKNATGFSVYSNTITANSANQFDGLNENYVITNTLLVGNITTPGNVDQLNIGQISQTVQYFDGLGRPMQTVMTQGSPTKQDIVVPVIYDPFGREFRKYLPVTSGSNGWYKTSLLDASNNYVTNLNYNNGDGDKIADDARPFSERMFEGSPLNRPLKDYGPGLGWNNTNVVPTPSVIYDKPVVHQYLVNNASTEQVIAWDLSTGLPLRNTASNSSVSGGYYKSGQLTIKSTTDEQGNEVREYVDKEGHVILKKVQAVVNPSFSDPNSYAQTYYIYDGLGLLRFILQPELVKALVQNNTNSPTQTDLANFGFQYKYDGRNRMVSKQAPGSGAVTMVYDILDRLIMTQDAVQYASNKWLYTKYDAFSRPIVTGLYTHTVSLDQPSMTNLISTTALFETRDNSQPHGYTNTVFNATNFPGTFDVYTVNYYDDYTFMTMTGWGADYSYTSSEIAADNTNNIPAQESVNNAMVIGHPTGTKVNVLGTTTFLNSVTYVDGKYRVIQTTAQNNKGGWDRSTNVVDFTGRVLKTKTTHHTSSHADQAVAYRYLYDHANRLLKTYHSVNASSEVNLISRNYNEIGQLVENNLYSTDGGNTFKQSLDYRYNIRAWLQSMNNSQLTNDGVKNDDANDLFGMELGYNTNIGTGNASLYNGNISGVKWSSNLALGAVKDVAYNYSYDPMNRITAANYLGNTTGVWANVTGQFNDNGYQYDLNGNIQTLQRTNSAGGTIDNLLYTYSGNQLVKVDDSGDKAKGFVDGANTDNDYAFDPNGNMTSDQNKNVTAITYNHLDLPMQITKGTGEKMTYTYGASGAKLSQQLYNTSGTLIRTTDYVGGFVYQNDTLQYINHGEGRVVMKNGSTEYQYHLRDHLNNTRVIFTTQPTQDVNTATYETANAITEQAKFLRYDNARRINSILFDHTNGNSTGYAERLNGTTNERDGLARSMSVMPGDTVKMEVYVKYVDTNSNDWTAALTTLMGQIAANNSSVVVDGANYSTSGSSFPYAMGLNGTTSSTGAGPKAYMNWLIFDRNFVFKNGGYVRMSDVPKEYGQDCAHEKLTASVPISEPGYVYVYLSNENDTPVEVYFDDWKVTQVKSPIVQQQDFYPFGLTAQSYARESSVPNNLLFNGGTELRSDLGFNMYETLFRMYDPALGRFWQIDLLADFFPGINPYSFGYNNPITFNDPDGLGPFDWLKRLINGFVGNGASRQARQAQRRANAHGTTRSTGHPNGGNGSGSQQQKPPGSNPPDPETPPLSGNFDIPGPPLAPGASVSGGPVLTHFEPPTVAYVPPVKPIRKKYPPHESDPDPDPGRKFRGKDIDGTPFDAYQFEGMKSREYHIPPNDDLISDLVKTLKDPSVRLNIQGNFNGEIYEGSWWSRPLGYPSADEIKSLMSARGEAIRAALIRAGVSPSQLSTSPGQAGTGKGNQSATFTLTVKP